MKRLLAGGEADAAIRFTIEHYGPDILGFLVASLRDPDTADDVYSMFCEDVWKGLTGFRCEGTLRSWLYAVGRRALVRHCRSVYERNRRDSSVLALLSIAADAVEAPAHEPQHWVSSNELSRLQAQLSEGDRRLLSLRIGRRLSWKDIVQSMAGGGEPLSGPVLCREAAAMRKRFERVKERLRALAKAGERVALEPLQHQST